MTKKKQNDDTHKDLTRLEDLSDFFHVEDAGVDDQFDGFKSLETDDETHLQNSDQNSDQNFEDEVPEFNLPPDLSEVQNLENELSETDNDSLEINFNESSDLSDLSELPELTQLSDFTEGADSITDSPAVDELIFEHSAESNLLGNEEENERDNEFSFSTPDSYELQNDPQENHQEEEVSEKKSENKFEEVKNFAQNFSYGQISAGGNPPFSLVIRNIKYSEEADDILVILRELGMVTTDEETQKAQRNLELGAMLIPQISEYSAIILAHKLRRFDCDLEVGLSDEVHPSKSGEINPRGLTKKSGLHQNILESYHKEENDTPSKEIIVSTTSSLEGYLIKKYIGVQTSFTIIDEEELERLKFVQQSLRANAPLEHYNSEDISNLTSERAFNDYKNSFDFLFLDLCDQLKTKAIKEKANALLGLNYQLTSLPFQKSTKGSCYQLTCSATLAIVKAL